MAEAIALNLREMAMLDTPIVVIVSGEGGSGGALGIAVGDRVLMQEFGVYSVIPPKAAPRSSGATQPEGRGGRGAEDHRARSAWRSASSTRSSRSPSAARTSTYDKAAALVDEAIARHLAEVRPMVPADRLDRALPEVPRDGHIGQAFRGRRDSRRHVRDAERAD